MTKKGGGKGRNGNLNPQRPFIATPAQRALVERAAAFGIRQDIICQLVTWDPKGDGVLQPISVPTLEKHFATEIAQATAKLVINIANPLFETATDRKHKSHALAAMFFLRTRGGFKETVKHEGAVDLNLDLSGATTEELAVLERFLIRKAGDDADKHVAANAA